MKHESMFRMPAFETAEAVAGASAPAAGQPSGAPAAGSPPATAGPKAEASQPQGAPEVFELVVAGQKEKYTREQLIEHAQKGLDYTSKTQKLADERRGWESEFRRREQEYNQRLQQDVQSEIQRLLREEPKAEGEDDPTRQLSTRLTQLEQRLEDERMTGVLATLKQKFPMLNEELFLLRAGREKVDWDGFDGLAQKMQEESSGLRTSWLTEALSDPKNELVTKQKQAWIDEYVKQKSLDSKPKGELGVSAGGSPGGGVPQAPRSFDEADARAMERLSKLPT